MKWYILVLPEFPLLILPSHIPDLFSPFASLYLYKDHWLWIILGEKIILSQYFYYFTSQTLLYCVPFSILKHILKYNILPHLRTSNVLREEINTITFSHTWKNSNHSFQVMFSCSAYFQIPPSLVNEVYFIQSASLNLYLKFHHMFLSFETLNFFHLKKNCLWLLLMAKTFQFLKTFQRKIKVMQYIKNNTIISIATIDIKYITTVLL